MSNRNSHANKAAARERLRAERERQAKKEKVRRQVIVGGSVVAALALVAGIAFAVSKINGSSDSGVWEAAKDKELVQPKNSSGEKGTSIVIGDPKAKETVELYEDMRCPACASFEQRVGETVLKDIKDGKYKVEYTMYSFIDGMAKGVGSKNALSALGAALNKSPEAFLEYKKALFSPENHPDERDDKFADDDYLIEIAQQVPALKDDQDFQKALKDGTFDRWALESEAIFGRKGVKGTPTILYKDKKVTDGTPRQYTPMTPEDYTAALEKAFSGK
ncbi:thioredoxin domain-containing protein [Streptomyces sp. URMC 123]|uniref:thioredoxin domain-containing protein n=1 Tax=Streptomyces sp. URMC 123 TaxID=3423403 RepID=UPI003F1DC05E